MLLTNFNCLKGYLVLISKYKFNTIVLGLWTYWGVVWGCDSVNDIEP